MDRTTELELLDELLALHAAGAPFLDALERDSAVSRYVSQEDFERERAHVFRPLPQVAAHAAELPTAHAFSRREVAGVPLLLTRDGEGQVHAFINACRHRSAQLVSDESGCLRRFVCPYHAWTYDTQGRLVGVPHAREGFPDLEQETRGLTRVACREAYGLVWVQLDGDDLEGHASYLASFLGSLAEDLEALGLASHTPFATSVQTRKVNWKVLVEGGLESYHFKVAHRETVGRLFEDNLSTYRTEGAHLRSVLARNTLGELVDRPRATWQIREVTNLLYTLMPTFQMLVQSDHVIAIQSNPVSFEETQLRLTTLVPDEALATAKPGYWQANHDLTIRTLDEDFDLAEGIQRSLASGANESLRFGRFEGALARFNEAVDEQIAHHVQA